MNQHRILPSFLVLILAAGVASAGKEQGKAYGEPLSGSDTMKISELVSTPDDYLGKTVRVEGLVNGVCEKRGCWMSLASDEEFQELRIKVDDGVIVFPVEAKGRRAVAEGVFTKIEMSMEQTLAYAKHHAEEHGEKYEPEKVTEPLVYFQVNATGAVIY